MAEQQKKKVERPKGDGDAEEFVKSYVQRGGQ